MHTAISSILFLFVATTASALPVHAQQPTFEDPPYEDTVFKAEVVAIVEEGTRPVEGTDVIEEYQTLTARITEGPRAGEEITVENDSTVLLSVGDDFYLHRLAPVGEEPELWSVGEPDRTWVLGALTVLFVVVTVVVAGYAGLRSLFALAGSFALIGYGLVPSLLGGMSPVIAAVLFGTIILSLNMFVTHRFNKPSAVALLGSIAALLFAALVAQVSVLLAKLSGLSSDEAVFLNFMTDGGIDLSGLLLGGILVGIIGVLNDVSVSQVHTVVELHDANPNLSRRSIWDRSMKVGREHMGAMVNTLPLAYAGVSLPLLLLFSQSDAPLSFILNREIFAEEIIRALAGTIGLMLSGAIATLLAVLMLVPKPPHATIEKNQ